MELQLSLLLTLVCVSLATSSLVSLTTTAGGSCANRCGDSDEGQGCACGADCTLGVNCCSDYEAVCLSCSNRCTESNTPNTACQCDSECQDRDACCQDYEQLCQSVTVVGNITDEEILELSEELCELDVNNVAANVSIDMQGITNNTDTDDVAPNPLFEWVDESVFEIETFKLYEAVADNFFKYDNVEENTTEEELEEIEDFLEGVCSTSVMERLEEFLLEKELINGTLVDALRSIWFTEYSRSGSVVDSSGFEHVFVGEIAESIVGGFHNWVKFYREEVKGDLNYMGYIEYTQLGSKGYVLTNRFTWLRANKPIGGGYVGPSPEFDMAMYTLCFLTRPNSACRVSTMGVEYTIQSYDYDGDPMVLGTAYTVV